MTSFTIIGHIFPVWLKFRGGKGVATYIGFVLGINYILGVIFVLCWLLIAVIKKYSSLASIASLLFIPLISLVLLNGMRIIIILSFLSILIILKHKSNIKRLLSNSETRIKL
jgi:glycerol-3-phosphate acyltransferase PlsY